MIDVKEIDELAIESVVMNDPLCVHGATFTGDHLIPAFALPSYIWELTEGEKSIKATVRCPICEVQYMEATKWFERELYAIYNTLPKEDTDGKDLG